MSAPSLPLLAPRSYVLAAVRARVKRWRRLRMARPDREPTERERREVHELLRAVTRGQLTRATIEYDRSSGGLRLLEENVRVVKPELQGAEAVSWPGGAGR